MYPPAKEANGSKNAEHVCPEGGDTIANSRGEQTISRFPTAKWSHVEYVFKTRKELSQYLDQGGRQRDRCKEKLGTSTSTIRVTDRVVARRSYKRINHD